MKYIFPRFGVTILCVIHVAGEFLSHTYYLVSVDVALVEALTPIEVKAGSEFICMYRTEELQSQLYCYDGIRCLIDQGGDFSTLQGPPSTGWKCKSSGRFF